MRINIIRIGVLEEFLPARTVVEYDGAPSLLEFLEFMERRCGQGFINEIISENQLKPHIVVLINGRSIKTFSDHLDMPIKDDDTIVIGIILDGG